MTAPVILSPHFDDAVFNCWYLINQPGAIVMTVFAGTPAKHRTTLWDRLCGEPSSRRMMVRRRAENRAALAGTNGRIINLDFLDAQYRETPISARQLADAIIASSPNATLYVAPLAGSRIRHHADHVLVREAALEIRQRGKQVAFYPDAPYMHLPARLTTKRKRRVSVRAREVLRHQAISMQLHALDPILRRSKRQAMQAYASQWRITNLVSLGGLSRLARRDYEIVFELNNAPLE